MLWGHSKQRLERFQVRMFRGDDLGCHNIVLMSKPGSLEGFDDLPIELMSMSDRYVYFLWDALDSQQP